MSGTTLPEEIQRCSDLLMIYADQGISSRTAYIIISNDIGRAKKAMEQGNDADRFHALAALRAHQ